MEVAELSPGKTLSQMSYTSIYQLYLKTVVQNLTNLLLVTYFRFHFSAQIHTSVGELHSGYEPVGTHYFALIATMYLGTILMFVYNL